MASYMRKFTRKQAGVIYRAVKTNKITMGREAVSYMYDLVDYYDSERIDWHGDINSAIRELKMAVDAIFDGNYEEAQECIDCFAG